MAYRDLNIARLSQKIADIKEALVVLRGYAARDDDAFLNNAEAIRSARYAFVEIWVTWMLSCPVYKT